MVSSVLRGVGLAAGAALVAGLSQAGPQVLLVLIGLAGVVIVLLLLASVAMLATGRGQGRGPGQADE